MTPYVLALVVLVAALLVAERRRSALGVWLTKPMASAAFVAMAVRAGATSTGYGRLVLLGLLLGWVGDVLLIPKSNATFVLGLSSFLLGHLAYAAAFALRGVSSAWTLAAAAVATALGFTVGRWLLTHVRGALRTPVKAYVGVISLMIALAVGAAGSRGEWAIAVGALLFYASDLSVAMNRFVRPGFANKAWGLPAYYAGQMVLAWTVSG